IGRGVRNGDVVLVIVLTGVVHIFIIARRGGLARNFPFFHRKVEHYLGNGVRFIIVVANRQGRGVVHYRQLFHEQLESVVVRKVKGVVAARVIVGYAHIDQLPVAGVGIARRNGNGIVAR